LIQFNLDKNAALEAAFFICQNGKLFN